MTAIVHAVRQLIVSPTAFFTEYSPIETIRYAAGFVILFGICLTITPLFVGSLIDGAVDTTVEVDNPQRPSEAMCSAEEVPDLVREQCAQPETIERDAGQIVQTAISEYAWIGIVVPVIMWPLGWAVLYGAGRAVGGTPSPAGTLSLAGWAALPEVVRLIGGLVGLQLTLGDLTITDTDPDRVVEVLQAATAPIELLLMGTSVCILLWQWWWLTGGLAAEADIEWRTAAVAVAVPLSIFGLLGL